MPSEFNMITLPNTNIAMAPWKMVPKGEDPFVFRRPTPLKTICWNLKITGNEEENHLNQTSIFGFNNIVFGSVFSGVN